MKRMERGVMERRDLERRVLSGWRREAILDVYILVCGAFLFVSPWLFGFVHRSGRVDAELVGAAMIAVSIAAIAAFAMWEEWVSLALGAWLIVAPWVLGFAHSRAMHVSIAVGVVVVYLAFLEIWLIRESRTVERRADA
jgi:SPW repeat